MRYEKELREIKQYNNLYKQAEKRYIKANSGVMKSIFSEESDITKEKEIKAWDNLVKKILKEKPFMTENQVNDFIREKIDSL